jgi:sugar lactone lactonase YvrE
LFYQVKCIKADLKLRMKTIKTFFVILLTAALAGCGGGGGGGGDTGGNPPSGSSGPIYTVSTLRLDNPLSAPSGLTVDTNGNLYVADTGNNLIQKVQHSGNGSYSVNKILGGGFGGGCLNSNLLSPYGVVLDSLGILYVSELSGADVLYADCGQGSFFPYGTSTLSSPSAIALRDDNHLYVADTGNHQIQLINQSSPGNGSTSWFAGTTSGYANGLSRNAAFSSPTGIAVSRSGDVFVTDYGNCAVRKISGGIVSTLAGAGPGALSCGSTDGTATAARFDHPSGIALDPTSGNLYVADAVSNKIRRITPQGVVTTIAGSGASGSLDGTGTSATFNTPTGIAVDSNGNVFVTESASGKIRKITVTP